MTIMYVANASAQEHLFMYRIPEESRMRQVPIRRGSQVALPDKNMNPDQINAIIAQHEKYGFVSTDEVKTGRIKRKFTRLVYSLGQPVSGLIIDALLNNNIGVLNEFGKKIREETAVAANAKIVDELQREKEENQLDADVGNVEMTIQEEEPTGGYDRPTKDIVAEGYQVQGKTDKPLSSFSPRRGGKRR